MGDIAKPAALKLLGPWYDRFDVTDVVRSLGIDPASLRVGAPARKESA